MTSEERARLKRLIDERRRELVASEAGGKGRCVECGGLHEHVTLGCHKCRERATQRMTRQRKREAVDIPTGERRVMSDGRKGMAIIARHGTETGYKTWGCRCYECRMAASEARRVRRRRQAARAAA